MDWCRRLSLFACPHHSAHSVSDRPHELRRHADHWRRRSGAGGWWRRGFRRKSGRGRASAVRSLEADGARRRNSCGSPGEACGATETGADPARAGATARGACGDSARGSRLSRTRSSRHRDGERGNSGCGPRQRWRHRIGSWHRYRKRERTGYRRRTRTVVPANANSILPPAATRARFTARLSPYRLLRRRREGKIDAARFQSVSRRGIQPAAERGASRAAVSAGRRTRWNADSGYRGYTVHLLSDRATVMLGKL